MSVLGELTNSTTCGNALLPFMAWSFLETENKCDRETERRERSCQSLEDVLLSSLFQELKLSQNPSALARETLYFDTLEIRTLPRLLTQQGIGPTNLHRSFFAFGLYWSSQVAIRNTTDKSA